MHKNCKFGAVAAGHEATAEVAMEVLRAGGNATDALIAAYAASFVAEPCMGSPGGGAFALLQNTGEEPIILDFFCQTPAHKKTAEEYEFIPYTVEFGEDSEVFYTGRGSVAVPGAIAGIFAMHQRGGSIPIRELFSPAIEKMKSGVALNGFQRYDLELLMGIVFHSEEGRKLFQGEDGVLKKVGDTVQMPALADLMEVLSIEGPGEFYRGEIARKQQYYYESEGGSVSAKDMENYRVEYRKPLNFPLGDYRVFTNPLPALGGAVMSAVLTELWDREQRVPTWRSEEYLEMFYRAFSFGRDLHLNPGKLDQWVGNQMSKKWGSTSHISIVDRRGNVAALTTTIGEGNGYFEPDSQIHMNNMLGESALLPGGYHSWATDVRLSSMMNPAICIGPGGDKLVLGSGGAGRIPYVLATVIWNVVKKGMDLREAIEKPRLHLDGNYFHLEKAEGVSCIGAWLKHPAKRWKINSLFFGGVHAVYQNPSGALSAVGDFRREGVERIE